MLIFWQRISFHTYPLPQRATHGPCFFTLLHFISFSPIEHKPNKLSNVYKAVYLFQYNVKKISDIYSNLYCRLLFFFFKSHKLNLKLYGWLHCVFKLNAQSHHYHQRRGRGGALNIFMTNAGPWSQKGWEIHLPEWCNVFELSPFGGFLRKYWYVFV